MEEGSFLVAEFLEVISCVLIAAIGAYMYFKPPSYGNSIFGYRTYRAIKTKDSWFFAQKFSGKWLCVTMFILAFIRFLMVFYDYLPDYLDLIYVLVFCLAPIIIIIVTERKLKAMHN